MNCKSNIEIKNVTGLVKDENMDKRKKVKLVNSN